MTLAATPSSLRKTNRTLVLRRMAQTPTATRWELARSVSTSFVTVGKIVDDLLEQGVLEVVELKRNIGPGRPSQALRLNSSVPRFVLVDLGVSRTRVSVAPLGAQVDWAAEMPTPDNAAQWESGIRDLLNQLLGENPSGIWGILLSMPGIVDESAGRVLFSPNCHWFEKADFRQILWSITRLPVEVVQEIRALALGQIAAAPSQKDFLLVDFGQGVGSASVINGSLFSGSLPLLGELGHTPVMENTRTCGCGARGCMETLLSQRGMIQSLHEQSRARRDLAWEDVVEHVSRQGVEPWLAQSLKAGASCIAGAMNMLGLSRVIITGLLPELPQPVQEYLAAQIRAAALWGRFGEVTIEFAPRHLTRGMIAVGIERFVAPAAV